MSGDVHVRFYERLGVRLPRATYLVMGFEDESDARRMMLDLKERPAKFGLALHEDKTRLLMFGRYAAERRAERGMGRPETFDFLGFTHYCGKSRNGRFIVKRKTQRKRMIRKLKELRLDMRKRMHIPVADQWQWLSAVLRGHYAYYGLTGNYRAIKRFLQEVEAIWQGALARRSQKARMFMPRFLKLLRRLPLPQLHSQPVSGSSCPVASGYSGKSRVRERRTLGSVRAVPGNWHRYSTTENMLKPPPLIRQNPTGIRDLSPHRFANGLPSAPRAETHVL